MATRAASNYLEAGAGTVAPVFKRLSLSSGAIAVSAPFVDAVQTWNNAAVLFVGLSFDITDTASANASEFFRFSHNGAARLYASKHGNVNIVGDGANGANLVARISADTVSRFSAGLDASNNPQIGFGPGNAGRDAFLFRDSTGALSARGASSAPGAVLQKAFISAKASGPYAVVALDSNKTFTNEGATAKIVFNLPTAVAGYRYMFVVQDADGIQAVAAAGDTIRIAGSVSGAAGNIDSTTVGSSVTLEAINATEWVAVAVTGTWVVT